MTDTMPLLPHDARTREEIDAWVAFVKANGKQIAASFDAAPPEGASETETMIWHRDLVVATIIHLQDGPAGNEHAYSTLLAERALPRTEAWRAGWWNLYLTEGRDWPEWNMKVKPAPALAKAWSWLEEWWDNTYLAAHPDIALRELMSSISEEALCASWAFDVSYAVWDVLQGTSAGWMRFLPAEDREQAKMLERLRELVEQAQCWWWLPDGATEKVKLTLDQWHQVYARTVNDPDRGRVIFSTGKDGKPKVYLGRAGVEQWLNDNPELMEQLREAADDEGPTP